VVSGSVILFLILALQYHAEALEAVRRRQTQPLDGTTLLLVGLWRRRPPALTVMTR
jgi:hypothetical protein